MSQTLGHGKEGQDDIKRYFIKGKGTLALCTINQRHHSTADIETQSSELGESREGLVARGPGLVAFVCEAPCVAIVVIVGLDIDEAILGIFPGLVVSCL